MTSSIGIISLVNIEFNLNMCAEIFLIFLHSFFQGEGENDGKFQWDASSSSDEDSPDTEEEQEDEEEIEMLVDEEVIL